MPTPTPAASSDPRRNIPRMDELLQLPEVESARQRLAEHAIRAIIQGVVTQARRGQLPAVRALLDHLAAEFAALHED